MDDALVAASQDGRDEDDEEDYEETGGGNRLLGFMFGNVDGSGDLDVDYLDEDAKEHFAALADKLGSSLTDIDLIKSSPTPTDASEQDYDEKAEDAIDYEDIDEQYDGPEIQASTEEDHLLKKDYFSSDTLLASFDQKGSVFDEENYDEDEETNNENEVVENNSGVQSSTGAQMEITSLTYVNKTSPDGCSSDTESPEADYMVSGLEDSEDKSNIEEEKVDSRSETSLPVLCVEDGKVILKFSEIFVIHDPLKKAERNDQRRHSTSKERVKALDVVDIEEDEEAFLRSSCHYLPTTKHLSSIVDEVEIDTHHAISGVDEHSKDSCLSAQPMKDDLSTNTAACRWSPLSPKFYPFDQQDWESAIFWGNSPSASHGCSEGCAVSELDNETNTDAELEDEHAHSTMELDNESQISFIEPFVSGKKSYSACPSIDKNYHPQLLRLESLQKKADLCSEEVNTKDVSEEAGRGAILCRFNKLTLQNKDLADGSWLDQVIWDPDEAIPKPKLILDLQDEQMLFEIFDHQDSDHLHTHAGAMVMMHSANPYAGEYLDHHNQGMPSVGRFNISNDKYYSNRKISQQVKSHAKKRPFHGIKVLHSVPALKLQTMKPKLSK